MEYRVEKKYICTNMELAILKAEITGSNVDRQESERN